MIVKADLQVGTDLPSLTRVGKMKESIGDNPSIHETSYAQTMGMRGALIGGTLLQGYMMEMLYGHFGVENWARNGKLHVRFVSGGVLQDDEVEIKATIAKIAPEGETQRVYLDVSMENRSSGKTNIIGTGSCLAP